MTPDALIVLVVLGIALIAFVTERVPIAQVAMAIPVVLLLTGVLEPAEALAGFSNDATITVAAMLVLSLGLTRTGVVRDLARLLERHERGSVGVRLFLLCGVAALASPFLSNTAVVVVLLPIFLAMARRNDQPPSLYLIPLSFSAILGGTVTLIGTSTNLVVAGLATRQGVEGLSVFSITPLGLIVLVVGTVYMWTVGRLLLPRREAPMDLSQRYGVREFQAELRVTQDTRALGEAPPREAWQERYGVSVVGIQRGEARPAGASTPLVLREDDRVLVRGNTDDLLAFAKAEGLGPPREPTEAEAADGDTRLVEVLVGPGAPLIGRTLGEVRFQQRHDCTVLAVQHHGLVVRRRLRDLRIRVGDLLLVRGTGAALANLAEHAGFVGLAEVDGTVRPIRRQVVAVLTMAAVVAAAGLGLASIVTCALTGAVVLLFAGCLRVEDIYADLDWGVLFLLAGTIPLGIAMDSSGAAALLADALARGLGDASPTLVVLVLYLVTSVLTEVMSNNAAAVVLTPVALSLAASTDASPTALVVAVMFGASASFMSPIGYQTNAMVHSAGGYRFIDFLKVGLPLNLLLAAVVAGVIPLMWPAG